MHNSGTITVLLLTIAALSGVVVGLITGILCRISGTCTATATMRGGGTAGATFSLMVATFASTGIFG